MALLVTNSQPSVSCAGRLIVAQAGETLKYLNIHLAGTAGTNYYAYETFGAATKYSVPASTDLIIQGMRVNHVRNAGSVDLVGVEFAYDDDGANTSPQFVGGTAFGTLHSYGRSAYQASTAESPGTNGEEYIVPDILIPDTKFPFMEQQLATQQSIVTLICVERPQ